MKRLTYILLAFIIVCLSAFPMTSYADPSTTVGTKVNIRCVFKSTMSVASCTVTLHRFSDMESSVPINDDSFNSSFKVKRLNYWEREIILEPGFYEVVGVTVPNINTTIRGSSERFEVKGDQMTVYVAVDRPEERVDMPDNWLVYGEDTQNFYIWAEEDDTSNNNSSSPDTSDDISSDTSMPIESLPGDIDEDISEVNPPHREELSTDTSYDVSLNEKEEPMSVKIGNYMYLIIIAALLVISFLLLKRIQRQRGL